MTSDLSVPCLRCSMPAQKEHHHREGPGPVGKGMGGTHEHLPRVPLCRADHTSLHNGEWAFKIEGDFFVGTKGGDFRCPVEYNDTGEDPYYWTPEKLREHWHTVQAAAGYLYKEQCREAWVLRERIAWMDEWYLEAAKMLSRDAERPINWRRVYDRVKSWETFELRLRGGKIWEEVEVIGERLRLAVAKSADPEKAMATAVVERLSGATVSQIERALSDGGKEEAPRCTCPDCGHEHRQKPKEQ